MSGEVRCWIDGRAAHGLDPAERVVQYGDGVFETLRVERGEAQYLDQHLQRLRAGCERLRLSPGDWPELVAELRERAGALDTGVLKVVLGRPPGGRGYRFEGAPAARRIVSVHALPPASGDNRERGISLRLCRLRLGLQPALAGIKHLNRLEQVMARAEWQEEYAEGLLFDSDGRLIEGTMSNLFLVRDGGLLTPRLDACGVAGVMRSVILELAGAQGIGWQRQAIRPRDLEAADEVFVCNSLIGIWPVIAVDGAWQFAPGPVTRLLQQCLAADDTTRTGLWYNV